MGYEVVRVADYQDWGSDEAYKGVADLILTDPPYQVTDAKWDRGIDPAKFWELVSRLGKADCMVLIFGVMPTLIDWYTSAPKEFKFSHDLIWVKNRGTTFMNANRLPMKQHELIWVFKRGRTIYTPQKIQGKPYSLKRRKDGTSPGSVLWGIKKITDKPNAGERYTTTALNYPIVNMAHHPTQKPLAMMTHLVNSYLPKTGGVVFDPFCGAGSTLVAAKHARREYIGGDFDEKWVEITQKRLDGTLGEYKQTLQRNVAVRQSLIGQLSLLGD